MIEPLRQSTRWTKNRIILWSTLGASLIANLALVITLRHYYVALKVAAVEPTFVSRFSGRNAKPALGDEQRLVVLFGDSRIASWDPLPEVGSYVFVNHGVGGNTTAQMLYRFESEVLSLKPAVVLIQAGINDLVAATLVPASEARYQDNVVANVSQMVKQATSAGVSVILLSIIPPGSPPIWRRFVWSDRMPMLVAETNRRLAQLHAPPLVRVIDSRKVLQTPEGAWKLGIARDALHLTPAGYAELNQAVGEILSKR